MTLDTIAAEAARIAAGIAASKREAMECWAESKARVAAFYGLPRRYYFGISSEQWAAVWQDYCDANGFAYYSGQVSIFSNNAMAAECVAIMESST